VTAVNNYTNANTDTNANQEEACPADNVRGPADTADADGEGHENAEHRPADAPDANTRDQQEHRSVDAPDANARDQQIKSLFERMNTSLLETSLLNAMLLDKITALEAIWAELNRPRPLRVVQPYPGISSLQGATPLEGKERLKMPASTLLEALQIIQLLRTKYIKTGLETFGNCQNITERLGMRRGGTGS
jgi:hypothetical protein